ncbi:hypothetical protein WR25_23231 [Diploscapter pachys]|uniref:Uncharacterized protein n=1 Tax=Diploscapter pachys TaxID=2018661 RepID=A0A2A2LA41_9BILA|nr:hypothetical protein WR25_23231 [Diploscapter pachys]
MHLLKFACQIDKSAKFTHSNLHRSIRQFAERKDEASCRAMSHPFKEQSNEWDEPPPRSPRQSSKPEDDSDSTSEKEIEPELKSLLDKLAIENDGECTRIIEDDLKKEKCDSDSDADSYFLRPVSTRSDLVEEASTSVDLSTLFLPTFPYLPRLLEQDTGMPPVNQRSREVSDCLFRMNAIPQAFINQFNRPVVKIENNFIIPQVYNFFKEKMNILKIFLLFNIASRCMYAKLKTKTRNGMKGAMKLLSFRANPQPYIPEEIMSTVFVAEIWETPEYLYREDPEMRQSWVFSDHQPPFVHVKFFVESNDPRFHKWLILPFGGSMFVPPPDGLRIGARYLVQLQNMAIDNKIQPWSRVKSHLIETNFPGGSGLGMDMQMEGQREKAFVPLIPLPADSFKVHVFRINRMGETREFIQLRTRLFRRRNLGHRRLNEHAELVMTDIGLAFAHNNDQLFEISTADLSEDCAIEYRTVIEPLPNNAIQMAEWVPMLQILEADSTPKQVEKYRARAYWRVTDLLWDEQDEAERGPQFVQIIEAPPLDMPISGMWDVKDQSCDLHSSKVQMTSALRNYFQKQSLRVQTPYDRLQLLSATLHYLELCVYDLTEELGLTFPAEFYKHLADAAYELRTLEESGLGRETMWNSSENRTGCWTERETKSILNAIGVLNELIDTDYRSGDEGYLMIFSVVYTIKIHMIFLSDVLKPNVDKKRIKELFAFLTDAGTNWVWATHLLMDYIEPLIFNKRAVKSSKADPRDPNEAKANNTKRL